MYAASQTHDADADAGAPLNEQSARNRTLGRPTNAIITDLIFEGAPCQLFIYPSRRLGGGGFGAVFEADVAAAHGRSLCVAVKTFSASLDMDRPERFAMQVSIWEKLSHPHIAPLYGMCTFGLGQIGLVIPLAKNGNMNQFLRIHPYEDRRRLLEQVAKALEYLHETARIVHGDLKCANVLIAEDKTALLSDFGLCTFVKRREENTATPFRMIYALPFAAPELLRDQAYETREEAYIPHRPPRSKTIHSDVFAFGSLIYEAFAEEAPWRGSNHITIMRNVLQGQIPPRAVTRALAEPTNDALWDLCVKCWNNDPFERPSTSEVRKMLTTAPDSAELRSPIST
ncbi:kinase-like protein [Auricularia subglabra TFB-10046 SS5]|nr:kinase-like protein [Auricularia subglabra TFB-10046 SS5]